MAQLTCSTVGFIALPEVVIRTHPPVRVCEEMVKMGHVELLLMAQPNMFPCLNA